MSFDDDYLDLLLSNYFEFDGDTSDDDGEDLFVNKPPPPPTEPPPVQKYQSFVCRQRQEPQEEHSWLPPPRLLAGALGDEDVTACSPLVGPDRICAKSSRWAQESGLTNAFVIKSAT